ncbi:hypothetical protein [Pseudomonas rossensis]|uniref:hypothetical protein n=1 Tax=Pseudomonas rossensis TaxID=2305471 RepID=UPI0032614CBC
MQVNRPSLSHQAPLDAPHNAATDATAASGAPKAGLKHRITSRTEDYLLRLCTHGTALQKQMAAVAYNALQYNTFMTNPARDTPVSQFGKSMTLGEHKGILLANFMPHDGKLELVALGFRAHRFFDNDAGSIDQVVLEHARELPEVKIAHFLADLPSTRDRPELQRPHADPQAQPQRTNTDESAHGAKSGPVQPSWDDLVAAERKKIAKDISSDKKSMHREMAEWLAEQRLNDGRSGSRAAALLTAHARVARVRVQKGFGNMMRVIKQQDAPLQPQAPAEWAVTNPMPATPPGQEYKFGKHEFDNFYEDHWLRDPANAPLDTFPERRPASLTSNDLLQQLGQQLKWSSAATPSTSSSVPSGRPKAMLMSDDDLMRLLHEQLAANARHDRQSPEELKGYWQSLQSNNEKPGTSSASSAGSDVSSISSKELNARREALPKEALAYLNAATNSDAAS